MTSDYGYLWLCSLRLSVHSHHSSAWHCFLPAAGQRRLKVGTPVRREAPTRPQAGRPASQAVRKAPEESRQSGARAQTAWVALSCAASQCRHATQVKRRLQTRPRALQVLSVTRPASAVRRSGARKPLTTLARVTQAPNTIASMRALVRVSVRSSITRARQIRRCLATLAVAVVNKLHLARSMWTACRARAP